MQYATFNIILSTNFILHYMKNLLCIRKQTQTSIIPNTIVILSIFKDINLKHVDAEVLTSTCKMNQEP